MMPVGLAQAAVAAAPDDGWLIDPELVDRGYRQTMAGGGIQTSLPAMPDPPATPDWLKSLFAALRDFFEWSQPAVKPLLWIAAIALALLLLYHFVPAFARWVDTLPFFRARKEGIEDDVEGVAEAGAARALLAEADALAAAGRFAEAIHLLLYRSVEDIEGRRPGLVRPAMTSRELAAAHDLPTVARTAFSRIARAVEISLFGGRAIGGETWESCRSAYAELTVPKNWARA